MIFLRIMDKYEFVPSKRFPISFLYEPNFCLLINLSIKAIRKKITFTKNFFSFYNLGRKFITRMILVYSHLVWSSAVLTTVSECTAL